MEILLKAFEKASKEVQYFALDVSLAELKRTFSEISVEEYKHVKLAALYGTYDDGLAWLAEPENLAKTKVVMSLGSSIGNFPRNEAARFLNGFSKVLTTSDLMIIGLDSCQNAARVFRAYNDPSDITHEFYRNGLANVNRLLGFEAFKQNEWDVLGRYNETLGGHEAFYVALAEVNIGEAQILKGEHLKVEESLKYSEAQTSELWRAAGLIQQATYVNQRGDYGKFAPIRRV